MQKSQAIVILTDRSVDAPRGPLKWNWASADGEELRDLQGHKKEFCYRLSDFHFV